jgi:hypothetical protein
LPVRIVKESITGAEKTKRKLSAKLSSRNIVSGAKNRLFTKKLKNN